MTDWIDHERALAGLPPRRRGSVLTGVSGHFSAAHHGPEGDPLRQSGIHGHTWVVTAWFRSDRGSDARCFKAALDSLLKLWDHSLMPPELAWGEDIARAVGTLANCVEVTVSREAEGFHARWLAHPQPTEEQS